MKVRTVSVDDDLEHLVGQINCATWDDANDLPAFDAESLKIYLDRQDTILVVCHDAEGGLLGIASSRVEIKPYGRQTWLYVDEVDVCLDKRRQGVGKQMMLALIRVASERGCQEVWLGTEVDNLPANALYRSLGPAEAASVIGYTYQA